MRIGVLVLFTCALASTVFGAASLTNADVIKLSKLGLGDEAIVAKVRQAEEVDFKIDTDDLIALKNAGVSGKIIAAMIDRTSASQSRQTYVPGPDGVQVVPVPASPVKLVDGENAVPLTSLLGEPSSTFAYVTVLLWENFPGLHASVRTSATSPSILITSDRDPRSRYYIVRLDVNEGDGDRSLKMGRSGAFSFKAGTNPDSDWTFPFDSVEEKKGTWRLALKTPLKKGEYGVYSVQGRELYDFGID